MIEVQKFEASWCGPCRMLSPTIEELKSKYPTVTFTNIDVDAEQEVAREAGIRNIPMVIIRKDGQVVDRIPGLNAYKIYEDKLNNLI